MSTSPQAGVVNINPNTSVPYNIIHGTYAELVVWLAMNIWSSHFGLPLLIGTILLSKKIQRHPTFVNMCITWMINGLISSILVWTGNVAGPEPPKTLCLVQASLLYGNPPMNATATFFLVLQMFIAIKSSYDGQNFARREGNVRMWMMIAAPYMTFLAFAIPTAIIGASHLDRVSRDRRFFYCSLEANTLTDVMTLFPAVMLLAALVLEVWTGIILFKSYRFFKRGGSRRLGPKELSLGIRVIAFGVYVVIGLSLGFLATARPASPAPDLVASTMATAVILIFGIQPDILRAWGILRTPVPAPSTLSVINDKVSRAGSETSSNAELV